MKLCGVSSRWPGLQAGQDAQIRTMVSSLELGGDGRTVSLGFSLSPEAIDALAALRNRRSRPRADAGSHSLTLFLPCLSLPRPLRKRRLPARRNAS